MAAQDSTAEKYILVLEDNADLRQMLIEIFEIEGYRVLSAPGGTEAWGVLTAQSRLPELIVSDLIMDGMDGCAFLMQLRSHTRFRAVPFIMLTVADEQQIPCWNPHSDREHFVRKPFTVTELLRVVRTILETQQTP